MDRYAVVGHPISHSKSPLIHRLFAKQTGQLLEYDAIDLPETGFLEGVSRFFSEGGCGLNVTLPFKQEAYEFVHQTTVRARQAGAVNTIYRDSEGILRGDNTDGVGLVRDIIQNLGWSLIGKSILILGAGGAVRGLLGPLLAAGPARITIANRSPAKAISLATAFRGEIPVEAIPQDELVNAHHRWDMLIDGTSAGLSENNMSLPASILKPKACCYILLYGSTAHPFCNWARNAGFACADGLGMLVEQAAEAFYIWRGVRPETKPILEYLRAHQR